jgi:hypothetical protein
VGNHRYHIFEPGSLEPGLYHWKWVSTHPFLDDIEVDGDVVTVGG